MTPDQRGPMTDEIFEQELFRLFHSNEDRVPASGKVYSWADVRCLKTAAGVMEKARIGTVSVSGIGSIPQIDDLGRPLNAGFQRVFVLAADGNHETITTHRQLTEDLVSFRDSVAPGQSPKTFPELLAHAQGQANLIAQQRRGVRGVIRRFRNP